MSPATATTKGFAVKCILCGEEGNVHVDLHDVASFHCNECDGDFTLDDVKAVLSRWQTCIAWLESAPALEE